MIKIPKKGIVNLMLDPDYGDISRIEATYDGSVLRMKITGKARSSRISIYINDEEFEFSGETAREFSKMILDLYKSELMGKLYDSITGIEVFDSPTEKIENDLKTAMNLLQELKNFKKSEHEKYRILIDYDREIVEFDSYDNSETKSGP